MKSFFPRLTSSFSINYPKRLAYMWQSSEYSVRRMLQWWVRVGNFRTFSRRGDLVLTNTSQLVWVIIEVIAWSYVLLNTLSIILFYESSTLKVVHALAAIALYPLAVVIISILPIVVLKLAKRPFEKRKLKKAGAIFSSHPATVIAVAGSYGKTSMKELLVTFLSDENGSVVSTAGNKNTLMSQAGIATKLSGKEKYVIVEFGEGAPGDIAKMVKLTQPDYAVITGLAPNHLDHYGTIENIINDLNALTNHVDKDKCYLNGDSILLDSSFPTNQTRYTSKGLDAWKTKDVKVGISSLEFSVTRGKDSYDARTGLVGRHNIGPIVMAMSIATEMGIAKKQIEDRANSLRPYEHRMEPRSIHGAWFIDDTYNGNIEGMVAGLSYLKEIKIVGRKLYATPGLVDQGDEMQRVHLQLGNAIGDCSPDFVYLMKNNVTDIILEGINQSGHKGNVVIIDDPLGFYTNIQYVLASGDVILCQNDWPDLYN